MIKFCAVKEREWRPKLFPFEIERCHCLISLSRFLEPLAYWTDLDNGEFHWQNTNSIMTSQR